MKISLFAGDYFLPFLSWLQAELFNISKIFVPGYALGILFPQQHKATDRTSLLNLKCLLCRVVIWVFAGSTMYLCVYVPRAAYKTAVRWVNREVLEEYPRMG